jgi:hypothetical protein
MIAGAIVPIGGMLPPGTIPPIGGMLPPGTILPIGGMLAPDIPAEPVVATKLLGTGGTTVLTLPAPNAGAPLEYVFVVGSEPSPMEL